MADRLHPEPGRTRTSKESELLGYPQVKLYDKNVLVKSRFERVDPDELLTVFDEELRIGVLPEIAGKKVIVKYSLQADGFEQPETGKLQLVFLK